MTNVNIPVIKHTSIKISCLACQKFAILLLIAPTSRPQNGYKCSFINCKPLYICFLACQNFTILVLIVPTECFQKSLFFLLIVLCFSSLSVLIFSLFFLFCCVFVSLTIRFPKTLASQTLQVSLFKPYQTHATNYLQRVPL